MSEKRPDIIKGVDPLFKRKIKSHSALNGLTLSEYTKMLAQADEFNQALFTIKKRQKKPYEQNIDDFKI